MKLVEMLGALLRREQQNETIREIVYSQIPIPLQQALAHSGIDPASFASGANFILQHIQVHGLPDDWAELVRQVRPDPAKVLTEPLTEEDKKEIPSEVEEFMAAWMKFKGAQGEDKPGSTSTEVC